MTEPQLIVVSRQNIEAYVAWLKEGFSVVQYRSHGCLTWNDCVCDPGWQIIEDYRRKPEKKYRPFSGAQIYLLRDKWLRNKNTSRIIKVIEFRNGEILADGTIISAAFALSNWEIMSDDFTESFPCGVEDT